MISFGAGGGVEALAAALTGASDVLCADVDPTACLLAQRNAALNGTTVRTTTEDLIGKRIDADLLLVGDACYDEALASRVVPWLRQLAAQGVEVLVGDPGRVPLEGLGVTLGTWQAPFDGDPRGQTLWPTSVTRVEARTTQGVTPQV